MFIILNYSGYGFRFATNWEKSLCPRETAVVKLFEKMVANNLYNQLRLVCSLDYGRICSAELIQLS